MTRVWAPDASAVDLIRDGRAERMVVDDGGWHRAAVAVEAGTDYAFSLDGGERRPDPRSRWQPNGVHASSRAFDEDAFTWTDHGWHGFHLPGSVLYELHIATFSQEGTFDGAIAHLDQLVELGVAAVEVMPVAAFDGDRGWGYDGVALGATHEPYGGPDAFKRFVDAAHARGLGVLLDVVYNHLGPSGAYLSEFGPYFSDHHQTPWGAAINLDGRQSREVRRFIIDNALSWLRDHHLDGLRLDAVHALADDSATHLLAELADDVRALAAHVGRPLWLIAESDANDPRLVRAPEAGGMGLHAVWTDDFHHALHVLLTGEQQGYYADYGTMADLAKALTDAFVYDGVWSPAQQAVRGAPTGGLPRDRFVIYVQNHDQVGNRAAGDRLVHLVGPQLAKVAAAVLLCAPGTPLLFMGEEWAASTPFPYFVGARGDELDDAVREGRRGEFAAFGWQPDDVPDPVSEATFTSARLDWDERSKPEHAEMLEWYRSLLALRRAEPALTDPRADRVHVAYDDHERWLVLERGGFEVIVNLSDTPRAVPVRDTPGRSVLLASGGPVTVTSATVIVPAGAVAITRRLTAGPDG